jgi:predicted exporter
VRPSLLLGGGTTVASFAGLAFADFPGFYQMCVLATVGVSAALATTLLLLPRWMGEPHGSASTRRAARWLGDRVVGLARHRTALAVVSLACAALALARRIHWVDDLSKLSAMNPDLVREDQQVRSRISSMDAGRVLVASGETLERAVAANDRLAARLPALVEGGVLAGFRSLHSFLWSEALQRENRAWLARDHRWSASSACMRPRASGRAPSRASRRPSRGRSPSRCAMRTWPPRRSAIWCARWCSISAIGPPSSRCSRA